MGKRLISRYVVNSLGGFPDFMMRLICATFHCAVCLFVKCSAKVCAHLAFLLAQVPRDVQGGREGSLTYLLGRLPQGIVTRFC
jgi:hypothetical protein